MGTKTNPGKFDCYEAAADDEPIFVLRANDPMAPATVEKWADLYADFKIREQGHLGPKAHEKYEEAMKCAETMRGWYRENVS